MNNKFSDGPHNLKNKKNDEENRVPSSQKDDSSPIIDNLNGRSNADNGHSQIESDEKVAENVKGVNLFYKSQRYRGQ
jgi:hypothetical protein